MLFPCDRCLIRDESKHVQDWLMLLSLKLEAEAGGSLSLSLA